MLRVAGLRIIQLFKEATIMVLIDVGQDRRHLEGGGTSPQLATCLVVHLGGFFR